VGAVGDDDLLAFREGYYDLLVALLWREPTADLVRVLAAGLTDRAEAAAGLHPRLGEGWEALATFLAERSAEAAAEAGADEFTRLFVGPGVPPVHPYESYYLTRRLLDRPLAAVRASVRELGLEKDAGYPEPEDHLAFELEVVRRLVARQRAAPDPEAAGRWLTAQATFLKRHLLVWGPAVARDLAAAPGAALYRGVGALLQGFLELERDVVREWGPAEVPTLEAARERAARVVDWRGPTFAVPEEPPPTGP
jgi:TorA maturation chaperone TorD